MLLKESGLTELENIIVSWNAVAPMFCIIFLGFVVRQTGFLAQEHLPAFNSVGFRFFSPFLLFYNIYHTTLESAFRPRLILFAVCAVCIAHAVTFFIVCRIEKSPAQRGVMIQGIFRSNFVLLGMPLAASLSPDSDIGVTALIAAVVVPLFNVLSVLTLEVFRGGKPQVGSILRGIATNPLILGSLAGLFFLLMGFTLPVFLDKAVSDLSKTATPFLLFTLGASFQFQNAKKHLRNLIVTVIGRLLVIPGMILGAAIVLGFRQIELITLVGASATPVAIASYVMAEQMGGDADLACDVVVYTSALSCLTLFLWTLLLRQSGMI